MMQCPKCQQDTTIVKNGVIQGKQRYLCKICNINYTTPTFGKPEQHKQRRALQLYLEGFSYRAVGKMLGVSDVTIMRWLKNTPADILTLRASHPPSYPILENTELAEYFAKNTEKNSRFMVISL